LVELLILFSFKSSILLIEFPLLLSLSFCSREERSLGETLTMEVVYLLFLLLVLPKGTTALSVARTAIWNQCSSSCASIGAQKSQEKKYAKPTITFCQLWENQASVIDPAIELGLRTLKRDFGNTVEFEWVKNILPGGCNDETFLHSSPSAVDLQMIKSVNGCSVFMGPGILP
jgi:hypothetical protein